MNTSRIYNSATNFVYALRVRHTCIGADRDKTKRKETLESPWCTLSIALGLLFGLFHRNKKQNSKTSLSSPFARVSPKFAASNCNLFLHIFIGFAVFGIINSFSNCATGRRCLSISIEEHRRPPGWRGGSPNADHLIKFHWVSTAASVRVAMAIKCNFCRTYFRCALDARISCISNVDIAEWMAFGMWNECISMHDQLSRNPRATIYIQFFRVWNLFEYFSLCFAVADLETFSSCINWIYERRHAIIVAPNSPTASSQSHTHHKWVSISVHCLRSSPRAHIFPVNFGMFVRK